MKGAIMRLEQIIEFAKYDYKETGYVAMDSSKEVWWYRYKPKMRSDFWVGSKEGTDVERITIRAETELDWTETLVDLSECNV